MVFEWNWSKRPADPNVRKEIATEIRDIRQQVFNQAKSREDLRYALDMVRRYHHEMALAYVKADTATFRVIQKIRRDWEIYKGLQ